MNVTVTLAELAAGTAILLLGRRLGGAVESAPRPPAIGAALRAEELESCPGCGADAVRFTYEEEVDGVGQGIEVVRCAGCGWKQVLPPL